MAVEKIKCGKCKANSGYTVNTFASGSSSNIDNSRSIVTHPTHTWRRIYFCTDCWDDVKPPTTD